MKIFAILTTLLFVSCDGQQKDNNVVKQEEFHAQTMRNTEQPMNKNEKLSITKEDSTFIFQTVARLNSEYFTDWCSGRENKCDSMGGWTFEDVEVRLFKDVNFKVFNFMGEYVGAYGSPMYANCIIDLNVNDSVFLDDTSSLFVVDSIYRLIETQYLIHSKGPVRMRGSEWSYFENAHVYHKKTVRKVCQSQLSHWIQNSIGNSSFYPNIDVEIEEFGNYISYDELDRTLQSSSWGYDEESRLDDSLFCIKTVNSFVFENDSFHLTSSDTLYDKRLFH